MSIWKSVKRSLGFGGDTDEDYDYETPTVHDDEEPQQKAIAEPDESNANVRAEEPAIEVPKFDTGVRDKIFDGVLAVFNSALPDFLQRSIDPDAQRKALSDSLDASVNSYIDGLTAEAVRYAQARQRSESEAARIESEKLRREIDSMTQQKNSIREQQLSADRRRRALKDRVTDLEAQLEKVEAEREQFELENRSLVNKLKLAEVQPGIIEELQKEIEQLKSGAPAPVEVVPEDVQKELEELRSRCADFDKANELSKNMYTEVQAQFAEAQAEIETLKANIATLEAVSAEAMDKSSAADEQKLAADERVTEAEAKVAEAEAKIADAESKVAESEAKVADANARIAELEGKVAEADNIGESVMELQTQLEKVQDVINKRDERIAKLKSTNKQLKEEVEALQKQLDEQKDSDTGLFTIPGGDMDDDFETPDWFVSEPGPDTPPLRPANSEFGYTEPPRRAQAPVNDAQLSLFD